MYDHIMKSELFNKWERLINFWDNTGFTQEQLNDLAQRFEDNEPRIKEASIVARDNRGDLHTFGRGWDKLDDSLPKNPPRRVILQIRHDWEVSIPHKMTDELFNDVIKWFTDNRDKFLRFKMTKEVSDDERYYEVDIRTAIAIEPAVSTKDMDDKIKVFQKKIEEKSI